jgi:hypothetical protein
VDRGAALHVLWLLVNNQHRKLVQWIHSCV